MVRVAAFEEPLEDILFDATPEIERPP